MYPDPLQAKVFSTNLCCFVLQNKLATWYEMSVVFKKLTQHGDWHQTHTLVHMCTHTHTHTHIQAVVNLLNILSSFAALREVLNQATPTTLSPWKRDSTPSTVFVSGTKFAKSSVLDFEDNGH